MNYRRLLVTVLFMLSAVPAIAAPAKLAQQGRVLDGDGAPLEGTHLMVFALYDGATDGPALWTEERSTDFAAGYYSITLGEQVPLDDLLFDTESVWLEVSIDGKTLSPRQEVVSVPYALRATAAEHVEGGMVDAAEISVDGTVVIDASGNWVGPTPAVGWGDLTDIPADIADGDQDEDTLAGLVCAEGQLPKWDAASSLWVCGDDIDTTDPNTDTLVSLACSTGQVAKWDGATWACGDDTDTTDPNSDTLQDLALTCFDGEIPSWDQSGGLWICIANTDTDTQLTNAEVGTAALAEGFVTGPHTTNTDTQLTESQVDTYVANNNYSVGAHTVDTDTQLADAQVDAFVSNAPINLFAGSTIDGKSMVEAFADAIYEGVGQLDNLALGTAKAYCLLGDIAISGACWAAAGSRMKSAQTDSEGHYCVAERVDTSIPSPSVYAGVRCLDLP